MSGIPTHAPLRTVLELAEVGYFADFEIVDEACAAGVPRKAGQEALTFAEDLGLVIVAGPVRLTPYGREVLSSPPVLAELEARLARPAIEVPVARLPGKLPSSLSEWRTFQHDNPAAAAAIARGVMVTSAEVFFRVRRGSEHLFASRFMRRVGVDLDPQFVRVGPPLMAPVAEGVVRWRGHGELVGALLDLEVTREDGIWVVTGELAWQLVEEGWHATPPQPVRAIEDRLGRLSPWFLVGIELAQRDHSSATSE